jgi:chorismate synthase
LSNTYGTCYKSTIFGESHSAAIGIVVDGIPAGMKIDFEYVRRAMARRAPGSQAGSTKRKETDDFEVLSGCVNGTATGAPLAAVIRNTDARPEDYGDILDMPRPGHAEYTGHVKFIGANDARGGGHFSGRLTAPLVFAGSIARLLLAQKGIAVGAHIKSIGDIEDQVFSVFSETELLSIEGNDFPVLDGAAGRRMQALIDQAARSKDSVGGMIECAAAGLPAGLGEPFFDSMESEIAHIMFAIPAIKGIGFGAGFRLAAMKGSEANDPLCMDAGGEVRFKTNNNGGINGGISNGMPLAFDVAVKPTPSIGQRQDTVNLRAKTNTRFKIQGRHDACIVPRAVEVVKSCCAMALADLYFRANL